MFGENKESAVKAYEELDKIKKEYAEMEKNFKETQEKVKVLEDSGELSRYKNENEELKKIISGQSEKLKEYQDMNQKLFLKVSMQVDEKPQKTEDEIAEENRQKIIDDIHAKIKAQHDEVLKNNKMEV